MTKEHDQQQFSVLRISPVEYRHLILVRFSLARHYQQQSYFDHRPATLQHERNVAFLITVDS